MAPVAFRHIISLIMLAVCVYEGFRSDKYLYLYYVFIFFLGLSSIITGYSGYFINKLFGTYVPIITAYAATYILIGKKGGGTLLIWIFICIGFLDAIITIGQYYHLGFVDSIYNLLRLSTDEEFMDLSERRMTLEGYTIPGIMGDVNNGYFLSVVVLIALYNKKCNVLVRLVLWTVAIFASFLAQERSGFFMAVFFSAFIIMKNMYTVNKFWGIVISVLLILAGTYFSLSYMDLFSSSDMRFTKGFDMGGRESLRATAWEYIMSNPFGGFYEYNAIGYRHPHNFFVNAILYGGVFGGMAIIVLLIIQIIKIIPYLFKKATDENVQGAFLWGLVYINYSINSLVHNASIVSGVFLFFVWWGAFLAFSKLEVGNDITIKKIKIQKEHSVIL